MNQQLIDQLVKLATIRVNNPLLNSDGKVILDDWDEGVSMSKLIELTVMECMDIISNQTTLDTNEDFREGFFHGRKLAWTEIRKQFGVEL